MKKKIAISICTIFICLFTKAQIHTEATAFNKIDQTAIVSDLPFSADVSEDAVKNKLKDLGYNGKDVQGFTVYKGVNIADFGSTAYDLYFKVDKKSKKEKDKSVVYLLISKGYENFATETADADLFTKGKAFVSQLLTNAASTDLERQIAEQEHILNKAQKKYSNSIEDGEDLEKKKKKIEQQIVDNFKEQAEEKVEAEKQRKVLDTLKAKRKLYTTNN